jgi:sulfur carrier protein
VIALKVNGRLVELPGPTRLLDYVAGLGVDPLGIAVELNARILERSEYASTGLADGDVLEIVRMVGGG